MESETKGSKRNSKAVPKQVLTNSEYLFLFYVSKTACLWFVHEVAWGDLGIFSFRGDVLALSSCSWGNGFIIPHGISERELRAARETGHLNDAVDVLQYKLTSDLCRVARLKTYSRTDQPVGRTFW